jgi:outer membrane protein assembly factor BamB
MRLRIRQALKAGVLAALAGLSLSAADWPQYLGPNRDGSSPEVPAQLPAKKELWRKPLGATEVHAGIAVAGGLVVVPDHQGDNDLVRCFKADTGDVVWTHSSENQAEMEYGNAARATPAILGDVVCTFSAVGEIYGLDLATGKVLWKVDCEQNLKASLPEWGFCATPLIADGKFIVSPAGPALVALDPKTGKVAWQIKGGGSAYASFITANLGGVMQIVGYDGADIAGWDLATHKLLWSATPENQGDFNVGTPVRVGDKLLYATDNNFARLFAFDAGGKLREPAVATSEDLKPDMATPIFYKEAIYGGSDAFVCLDPADLKTLWSNDKLGGFSNLIAGNDRIMIFDDGGKLTLIAANKEKCEVLGEMKLCAKTWASPALADGRLFIRDEKFIYCYAMK